MHCPFSTALLLMDAAVLSVVVIFENSNKNFSRPFDVSHELSLYISVDHHC